MILQIGSGALYNHNFRAIEKISNDLDFIATHDDFQEFYKILVDKKLVKSCYPLTDKKIVVQLDMRRVFTATLQNHMLKPQTEFLEFEIAYPDSVAEKILEAELSYNPKSLLLMHSFTREAVDLNNYRYRIASKEMLLFLKTSHRYLKNSPHFEKTMRDIIELRKVSTIPLNWRTLLEQREAETYNYSHPNLNVVKKDFFTSNVNYVYDHDSIHRAVAFLEKPAYEFYKKSGADVMCDRDKFEACSLDIRTFGVLEEAFVLALERSQIPFDFKPNPDESFKIALQKICTSVTSGWFREYAWENYFRIMSLYNKNKHPASGYDYVEKFKSALAQGKIEKYEKLV